MSSSIPALHTPRLLLRPIVDSDLPKVFEGLSHPDVIRYYGVSFSTLEATKEQMTWFSDQEQKGTGRWWAVCEAESGAFLGTGGFTEWQSDHAKAEIGFWTGN